MRSPRGTSGGANRSPDLRHAQLVQTLDGGREEAVAIPVNLILMCRAPYVALKDGDILYVPTNNLKLVTIQAISDMVSLGTSFVLYRATTSIQSPQLSKWIPPDGLEPARRN
jgi:hypothetical protein